MSPQHLDHLTEAADPTVVVNASGVATLPALKADAGSEFLEGCLLVNFSADNDDWISRQTELTANKIRSAILLPVLFAVGAPANVLCMVVFYKHGLRDRINVCLFGRALVDLVYIAFHFVLQGEQMFQFHSHKKYGYLGALIINNKLLGLRGFGSGSVFLTAVISCERCVCVLFPLRSRALLSARTMAVVVISGVLVASVPEFIIMARYGVICYYETSAGWELRDLYVTNFYAQNKTLINIINSFFYGVFISMGCPLVVMVATVMTAFRLWQSASWRKFTALSRESTKEAAVTRMLLALSTQFLVFSVPQVMIKLVPYFDPEFTVGGRHGATLLFLNLIWNFLTCVDSTIPFFVYVSAGSKFRDTVRGLCRVSVLKKKEFSRGSRSLAK